VRILLINDNSAHNNWGAEATPHALMKMLREQAPGVEIKAIPHAWLRTEYRRVKVPGIVDMSYRVGSVRRVNVVARKLFDEIDFFPRVADDFSLFGQLWRHGEGGPLAEEFQGWAENADVVVYNAENSVYRNTTEACRAMFLLWYSQTVLKKPSAAVNMTAQLNTVRPILNGMVLETLPKLDLVSVREVASFENLKELGIDNVHLGADVVFGVCPEEYSATDFESWRQQVGLEEPFFCFSASALPVSKPRGQWDGEVVHLVKELQELIPNAVMVAKDHHCLFLEEVAKRTGARFFGPEHDFSQLWPLFRRASFLVTGHFHYAIFASMVGCPFVPLTTNNHKMRGLCQLLEWPCNDPFDITAISVARQGIVECAETLLDKGLDVRRALEHRSSELRGTVRTMAQRVVALGLR